MEKMGGGGNKVEVKKSCYQFYVGPYNTYTYIYVYEARYDKICGFLNVKEKRWVSLICENSLVIDMCRKVWKLNTVAFQRTETFTGNFPRILHVHDASCKSFKSLTVVNSI